MTKRKTFITALAFVMAICMSFAMIFALNGKHAKAEVAELQDKKLSFTMSCYKPTGESAGSIQDGSWGSIKAAGYTKSFVNIIFGDSARYVTFAFDEPFVAEGYESIRFKMNYFTGDSVGPRSDKAQIFKPDIVDGKVSGTSRTATNVEVDAGWFVDSTSGLAETMNVPVVTAVIPVEAITQTDGKVYGFTIYNQSKCVGGGHLAIGDIVAKVPASDTKPEETSEVSVTYDFDGTQAFGKYSNGAFDPDRNDIDLHIENDNLNNLFQGNDGSTKLMFTGTGGIADGGIDIDGWVKIEFAKKVKASDFPAMIIRMLIPNWVNDETTTTMYKLDDTGFETPIFSTKTAFANVDKKWLVETAKLADVDGYVEGFMLKRAAKDGARAQFFFDYVEFLIEADIPKPVVSESKTTKDISEVLPVGANGVTLTLTSNGEAFGSYDKKVVTNKVNADEIVFNFTPVCEGDAKFSTYFLLNATNEQEIIEETDGETKPKAKADYEKSGLVFWFAYDNILIGNGVKNDYAKLLKANFPEGAFSNGQATKVKISAVPYYLDGVQGGYYLAVYINDATDPCLEHMIESSEAVIGNYTKVIMQDLSKAEDQNKGYSVKLAAATA